MRRNDPVHGVTVAPTAAQPPGGLASLIWLFAQLPSGLSLSLACISAVLLHDWSHLSPGSINPLAGFGYRLRITMLRDMAFWLQFLLPLLFLTGALARCAGERLWRHLSPARGPDREQTSVQHLAQRVGTALRRHGLAVVESRDAGLRGVDLLVDHDGNCRLIRCLRPISPELALGALIGLHRAREGSGFSTAMLVSEFPPSNLARGYARWRRIELLTGTRLQALLAEPAPDYAREIER